MSERQRGLNGGESDGKWLIRVRFFGFGAVKSVGFAFQFHDGGAMNDAIQHGHRQLGVAEVFGPGVEVDVGHQGGADALAAGVDDLVPQAGCLRTEAAFDAVEPEFVNDQKAEFRVEADAFVDGLVGQGGGEVFEEFAAGNVMDALFEHASGQADALDQSAFAQAGLAREDHVLAAADEVALGQGFDLHTWDGWVEIPVEGAQRQGLTEVGFLDEPFDAALASRTGLIGEEALQELQVRAAVLFGVGQSGVELLGRHRDA